jgi:hypothetical protein
MCATYAGVVARLLKPWFTNLPYMTKGVAKIFERKTTVTVLLPQTAVIRPSWVYPENIPFRLILLWINHCSVVDRNTLYPSGFIQGVPSVMVMDSTKNLVTAGRGEARACRSSRQSRLQKPNAARGLEPHAEEDTQ